MSTHAIAVENRGGKLFLRGDDFMPAELWVTKELLDTKPACISIYGDRLVISLENAWATYSYVSEHDQVVVFRCGNA